MNRKQFTILACGIAALGVGGLALRRKSESPGVRSPADDPEPAAAAPPAVPAPEPGPPTPTAVRPVAAPSPRQRASAPAEALRRDPVNESALMTQLRDLGATDPATTLQLARQGNRQFTDSEDAAERSWMIVKALMELGRAEEARAEARVMVEKYRGTSWAADVYRHMLLNPSPDPSERGHGKTNELP